MMLTIPLLGYKSRLMLARDGAFLWLGRRGWLVKPPWNRPLFSERNGFVRVLFRAFGWRLIYRINDAHP